MAEIVLEDICKRYGNGFEAVSDLNLRIADAEFLVLVGPSGCGKTTALRMVAGLEEITSGSVYVNGRRVNDVLEKDRDMAMVFQNYALYPHMTVADNIGFSLKLSRVPKDELRARVRETAELLALESMLDRRPRQLSGGQRQRVAMGRAIIRHPQAFLMDEPLSNLDAKLRVQMRGEIAGLQNRLGVTTLYVTHDQIEAMTMGDRVAVLDAGRLQQVGTPHEIYDQPANLFVAGFIGSPPMNLLHGKVLAGDGGPVVALGSARIPMAPEQADRRRLAAWIDRDVVVGVRPEDVHHVQGADDPMADRPGVATWTTAVRRTEAVGASLLVYVNIDAEPAHKVAKVAVGGETLDEAPIVAGDSTGTPMCAAFEPRSFVKPGDQVQVAVAGERLHLFDPAGGRSLSALAAETAGVGAAV
jgi:multiple sugar transport system ATP-binding protein